ncbi:hypothetical protein QIG17_25790, partial [Klebsiella pneumoniae]|nr:hypothetical protein [Klebsiella pneumoniae]
RAINLQGMLMQFQPVFSWLAVMVILMIFRGTILFMVVTIHAKERCDFLKVALHCRQKIFG